MVPPREVQEPTLAWTVGRAKTKFLELLAAVGTIGPQTITKRGRPAVIVISIEEWERNAQLARNLAEFFACSPLGESSLEVRRTIDKPRNIEL